MTALKYAHNKYIIGMFFLLDTIIIIIIIVSLEKILYL